MIGSSLTRSARKMVADMPLASSYSPRSLGVNDVSHDELNMRPSIVFGWARNNCGSMTNRVSSTTNVTRSVFVTVVLTMVCSCTFLCGVERVSSLVACFVLWRFRWWWVGAPMMIEEESVVGTGETDFDLFFVLWDLIGWCGKCNSGLVEPKSDIDYWWKTSQQSSVGVFTTGRLENSVCWLFVCTSCLHRRWRANG